jgi:hypothetical protein
LRSHTGITGCLRKLLSSLQLNQKKFLTMFYDISRLQIYSYFFNQNKINALFMRYSTNLSFSAELRVSSFPTPLLGTNCDHSLCSRYRSIILTLSNCALLYSGDSVYSKRSVVQFLKTIGTQVFCISEILRSSLDSFLRRGHILVIMMLPALNFYFCNCG